VQSMITKAIFAVLCAITGPALAQDYPTKPVKVIMFYAPGGPTDFIGRTVAEKLQQKFGQPFVVEAKQGANLRIGSEFVAKSAPDGYTIGVTGVPHATNPSLFPNMPYDTLKDLAGLAHLVDAPLVLSTPATSPIKTVADLIAMAKAKPGEVNIGTAGNGTGPHLSMEFLFLVANANYTHVPYKGDTPAVTELLGGRLTAGSNTLQSVLQHIKGGRLRALAVSTKERVAAAPEIPTLVEQGFPDNVVNTWFGMILPAGVPKDIVNKLSREINAALAMPDVREKILATGLIPVGGTPEQFDAHIRREMERWAKVIKARGIKAD
jgi:tripartite-type tricarboxylate transporter receptor subunit TctC